MKWERSSQQKYGETNEKKLGLGGSGGIRGLAQSVSKEHFHRTQSNKAEE